MKLFDNFGDLSWKGKAYQNLSDPGSMLFGGADSHNSLGMKRDGTKSGMFGDAGKGIDWFGSPVTAGTDMQGPARLAAILYGGWMGAGAMGGGAAGGGAAGGSAGGGAAGGGAAGGAAGGTSAGATTGAGGAGSTSPAWMQWARMGGGAANNMLNQKQPYKPDMKMIEDDPGEQKLLAELLRRY